MAKMVGANKLTRPVASILLTLQFKLQIQLKAKWVIALPEEDLVPLRTNLNNNLIYFNEKMTVSLPIANYKV
jgi:hypothetical protein